MENAPVSKYTISFGLSVALSSVINALLVVVKEKSQAVLAALLDTGGAVAAFPIAALLFKKKLT